MKSSNRDRKAKGDSDELIPPHLLTFLNSLDPAAAGSTAEHALRTALLELLPGVDHITIAINARCPLVILDGERIEQPAPTAADVGINRPVIEGALLASVRASGFAFAEYQPPQIFLYDNTAGDYLGAIILWRRHDDVDSADALSFPDTTLALVDALRPFIRYQMESLVTRQHYLRSHRTRT